MHSELSVHSFQPKTEILVNRIIDAFSHQKSRLREVQKDANAEKQAKSEALEKVRSLEQRIIREKQEYEAHLRSTQTDYDRRLQNEALAHSRVVDELKKSFQTERQRAQLAYDSELQQKQLMIEELKQDLYDQKEQVKGLADRDLTSRFKTISKSIEEFSRLDWDPSREATWPYSEDELRNFHRNPRRLKQQIVQNCIWLMLNEIIFRTPFRIIGEHGRQFDAELYAFNSPGK